MHLDDSFFEEKRLLDSQFVKLLLILSELVVLSQGELDDVDVWHGILTSSKSPLILQLIFLLLSKLFLRTIDYLIDLLVVKVVQVVAVDG